MGRIKKILAFLLTGLLLASNVAYASPGADQDVSDICYFRNDTPADNGAEVYYSIDGEGLQKIASGERIGVSGISAVAFYVKIEEAHEYKGISFVAGSQSGTVTSIWQTPEYIGGKYFGQQTAQAAELGCTYEFHYSSFGQAYQGESGVRAFYINTSQASAFTSITYYKNDGTGACTSQNAEQGAEVILLGSDTFYRAGYVLTKWNTRSDGTGKNYSLNSAYLVGDQPVRLYAVWKKKAVNVVITGNSGCVTYTGEEQSISGFSYRAVNEEGEDISADVHVRLKNPYVAQAKGTEAGVYPMLLKEEYFQVSAAGYDAADVRVEDGILTIEKSCQLTFCETETTGYKGVYDGKAHDAVTNVKVTGINGEPISEEDITLKYRTDAGEWTEKMPQVTDVSDSTAVEIQAVSPNYEPAAATVRAEVEKRGITVTTQSGTKTYDGSSLTAEGEVSGILRGETYGFRTTGSQTYVGDSVNTFRIDWSSTENDYTAQESNYTISEELGVLTVTDGTDQDPVDPDAVAVKTHTDPEGGCFKAGDEITFTIEAVNIYDENKTVTLTEIEGVTLSKSVFADVEPGETVTARAWYTVGEKDLAAGCIINTVTVSFSGEDRTYTAEDRVDELEQPEGHLTIVKKAVQEQVGQVYGPGDTVTYEIMAVNDGNQTLVDIEVNDDLTADAWRIESLAPGESQIFTAEYEINEKDILRGSVTNTATARAKCRDYDEEPVIVPGSAEIFTEPAVSELEVQKWICDPEEEYQIGDTVYYQIQVTNSGNVTQEDVIVKDFLSASGDIVITDIAGTDGTAAGAHVLLEKLSPGESAVISCEYTVRKEDRGSVITNVAVAESADGSQDRTREVEAKIAAVYDIHVTHVFAEGQEGCLFLPEDYTIENQYPGMEVRISAESLTGYVSRPAELLVTVDNEDVTVVFTYYKEIAAGPAELPSEPEPQTPAEPAAPAPQEVSEPAAALEPAEDIPTTEVQEETVEAKKTFGGYSLEEIASYRYDMDGTATIAEEDTPLAAPASVSDHACCFLHFLLLLAALIVELIYVYKSKKGQERIFEMRRQLAAGPHKKSGGSQER